MLLLCVRGECTLRPGTTGQQPTGSPSSSSSPWSSSSSLLVSPVRCTQADQDPDQEFRDNPWQKQCWEVHGEGQGDVGQNYFLQATRREEAIALKKMSTLGQDILLSL